MTPVEKNSGRWLSIRRPTSLASRLIAVSILAAIVAMIAANLLAYAGLRRTLLEQVDTSLRTLRLPKPDATGKGVRRLAPTFYLEVRGSDGTILDRVEASDDSGKSIRPDLPDDLDLEGTSIDPDGIAKFFTVKGIDTSSRFRVKAAAFSDGRALILAATLDQTQSTLRRTVATQVTITALVAALAALIAAASVRRSLRPLTQLEQTVSAISSGDRSARVQPSGPRDIRELAESFNVMVDRLDQSIGAETATAARTRRFIDDAAHELRTPITAVSAYSDLLANGQQRGSEEMARIHRGLVVESGRLRQLVEELLLLARTDQVLGPDTTTDAVLVRPERVDLVPIALEAADLSMLVGPAWPIDLEVPETAWCHGSEPEVRRVFDNLLANIRTHTPPGTAGRVAIMLDGSTVRVCVEDDGPGLSPEELPRIFDRFWRSDASRARATGGSGLGLSIVQAIVDRLGGTVDVQQSVRHGISVTVELRMSQP